jgi:hypothetical protein
MRTSRSGGVIRSLTCNLKIKIKMLLVINKEWETCIYTKSVLYYLTELLFSTILARHIPKDPIDSFLFIDNSDVLLLFSFYTELEVDHGFKAGLF